MYVTEVKCRITPVNLLRCNSRASRNLESTGEPMTFQHLLCFSPGLATVHWHKQVAVMPTALEVKPKVNRTVAERWNGSILRLCTLASLYSRDCLTWTESGEGRTYWVNFDR